MTDNLDKYRHAALMKSILIITVLIFPLLFIVNCGTYIHNSGTSGSLKGLGITSIDQPEFCASCHMMKKYYNSWKTSKHGEEGITCTVCHYAPKIENGVTTDISKFGDIFTYLSAEGRNVRMPTKVSDGSCMTSDCHPKDKFLNKEIKFTEKVPFVHVTHEEKTIEGQKLHCDTCHQNITVGKHFEVTEKVCYLCHFKNTEFNKGRAKCSLCHEIPTRSLQSQKKESNPDEKPITHQSLEKAGVSCQSCHYEIIQGNGDVQGQKCFNCHNYSFEVEKKAGEKKLMHTEHVAGQHVAGQLARCFDCHEPIQHKVTDFLDPVRLNCKACHPDHHRNQRILLTGKGGKGVPVIPSLMFSVNTNCFGCHKEERIVNGEPVAHGTGKACAACHKEKHEKMAKDWKVTTDEEVKGAKEIEKEALNAIENANGKVPEEILKEAAAIIKEGQGNLYIVEYGGGVHNQKYSVKLLDHAMNRFEDAIDLLNGDM